MDELDANQQIITGLTTYKPEELTLMAKKSGENKTFRESLTELLDIPVDREAMNEIMGSLGANVKMTKPTMSDFLAAGMIAKAAMGDTKAFEVVRDTMGQKPTDKVEEDRTIRVLMDDKVKEYGE